VIATLVDGAAGSAAPSSMNGLVSIRREDRAMGGRLVVRVTTQPARAGDAARDAEIAARRVRAWAAVLTRHDADSQLMRLNADPRSDVAVRPTLAAALRWAAEASEWTGGIVDPTLLDERLAAEAVISGRGRDGDDDAGLMRRGRSWSLARLPGSPGRERGSLLSRRPGLRLDLDGVGKGWLADRALSLLERHPGAIVDADGDVAVRLAPGERIEVGVADPRSAGMSLAVLALEAPATRQTTWGVATSGTSVHRWRTTDGDAHHLIDPRTGRPAVTDVVQATVIAATARSAEALAKTAVILGSFRALDVLDRIGASGAILLLFDGRTLALPSTTRFLA
jgi:thiamine biosynthesis lipoprotein